MDMTIDLNSDVGERPEALRDGSEEKLISLITSANIACGGHAGNEQSMTAVMKLCAKHNVAIGAHPGYPDKDHFGRKRLDISFDRVAESVCEQVSTLCTLADSLGFGVKHVKPHGALYNAAVSDAELAWAIARGVKKVGRNFILFGLAGSQMLRVWSNEGFSVVGEAFADRRYEDDGSLRSRQYPDALITGPKVVAAQALKIAKECKVVTVNGSVISVPAQTICLHSDTPGSLRNASEIQQVFVREGIRVESFARRLKGDTSRDSLQWAPKKSPPF